MDWRAIRGGLGLALLDPFGHFGARLEWDRGFY